MVMKGQKVLIHNEYRKKRKKVRRAQKEKKKEGRMKSISGPSPEKLNKER
jgi:hypothetical protein